MKFRPFWKKQETPRILVPEFSPVPLSAEMILNTPVDTELLNLLSNELLRVIPREITNGHCDELAVFIKTLPIGLRSMAAVHRLDISLSLDSLLEHFANFPGSAYAEETHKGLRELGFPEIAEQFENALITLGPMIDHYRIEDVNPELKSQLTAITETIWELLEREALESLMDVWPEYARAYPEKVCLEQTEG